MTGFKQSEHQGAPRHMAVPKARGVARASSAHTARGPRVPRGRRVDLPVLTACAVVLVLAAAGGMFAWYMHQASRTNTFQSAELVPSVEENFDKTTKSNVTVKANDTSVPVYIRAQVAIGWVTSDGADAIFAEPVAGTDYVMAWGAAVYERGSASAEQLSAGCWVKGSDGFYYWSKPVQAGKSTGQLVDTCTWKSVSGAADGRKLSVDISAQALQADTDPAAFDDAWSAASGLKVGNDGVLAVSNS